MAADREQTGEQEREDEAGSREASGRARNIGQGCRQGRKVE